MNELPQWQPVLVLELGNLHQMRIGTGLMQLRRLVKVRQEVGMKRPADALKLYHLVRVSLGLVAIELGMECPG